MHKLSDSAAGFQSRRWSRKVPARRRTATLLAVLLGALAVALFLAPPRPAGAIVCPSGFHQTFTIIYYPDATFKRGEEVGECSECDGTCTGERTRFSIVFLACCPTVV